MIKDRFIIAGLKRGDIRIFESLFHRYYPGLCTYAESLLRRSGPAEEMVQDIFYTLWKNRGEIEIRSSLKSYLYKSVYNRSMMFLRKSRREVRLDEQWAEKQADRHNTPIEKIGEEELSLKIADTLSHLPERTRTIFTMNRIEGLKYKEIAEKLSISVKTVEANMGKALSALRKSLSEYSSS
jgi:RNA polymerase sigma-70 factor (ECF subfamily)